MYIIQNEYLELIVSEIGAENLFPYGIKWMICNIYGKGILNIGQIIHRFYFLLLVTGKITNML